MASFHPSGERRVYTRKHVPTSVRASDRAFISIVAALLIAFCAGLFFGIYLAAREQVCATVYSRGAPVPICMGGISPAEFQRRVAE